MKKQGLPAVSYTPPASTENAVRRWAAEHGWNVVRVTRTGDGLFRALVRRDVVPTGEFLRGVCELTGIEMAWLLGPARRRQVSEPRFIAFWGLRHLAGLSYPQIGKLMRRDHSTVIYGARNATMAQKKLAVIAWRMVKEDRKEAAA